MTDSESESEGRVREVTDKISPTLAKVGTTAREDEKTSNGLDKLREQLRNSEFQAGRGSQKLPGSKKIYYMRGGGKARLFFKYSETERGVVEILAESNKDLETQAIKNLLKNHK